tara:strand:+ start:1666 stop:2910 length:1245 start_codon:yes stop_codon:yes gene_type:complete
MPIVDIKGVGKAQFPDGMSADSIRDFLRKKYAQQAMNGESDILARQPSTAQPYEPTLSERMGQGVSDTLYNSGLVSDRYGAQQVGGTISSIGEMLPGIGDAAAGDEFGRAVAEGDKVGMGIGLLGAIPIAGDALKGGAKKAIDAMGEFTKFSDKTGARRAAKMEVYDLPTMGKAENIKDITDLFDYTPEQLISQIKTLDSVGIRQGGYLKKGDGLDVFYANDGTSKMIDSKTGNVIFEQSAEQTENLIKNDILDIASNTLTQEQKAAAYQARKTTEEANRAREAQLQEGYKMQHTAPMREDNPSGDDVTNVFDKDIYTGNALRYFGTGSDYDNKAIKIIQGMKGNPDKPVTIYRAVPKSVKDINSTDWVTTTKEYAQDHMKGENGWHILSKKVKAKDIATDGNSIHEFGYDPAQ